jgi:hypothetical protein
MITELIERLNHSLDLDLRADNYIGMLRKQLTNSSSIGHNRLGGGHGYHIEVTGAAGPMQFFPLVTSSKYLETRETDEKRRYYARINVKLNRANFEALIQRAIDAEPTTYSEARTFFEECRTTLREGSAETFTHVTFNKRSTGQMQLEIGYKREDDSLFTSFRKVLLPGDTLIFLQINAQDYEVIGVPQGEVNFDDIPEYEIARMNTSVQAYSHIDATPAISSTEIILSKPFLLLAGISGTGKTRFVRKQAEQACTNFGLEEKYNYCSVPVRPNWHEPSDLLGYVSRIKGTKYIATDFLKFMVKAIAASTDSVNNEKIKWKDFDSVPPFWLCLDEMNLAPVEQYFSDYLSILETREWSEYGYKSDPMMSANVLKQLNISVNDKEQNSLVALWDELFDGVTSDNKDELCNYFLIHGIPIPPNLIVAGTVNMDETTHGFSRKVIDRALTIDFQEFFPNDFEAFLKKPIEPKLFSFPVHSQAQDADLTDITTQVNTSITFLEKLNVMLRATPYELAFRALNELILTVKCFAPYGGEETEFKLEAVWDDFLMQKVLPRIEGDSQKLKFIQEEDQETYTSTFLDKEAGKYGKGSILHQLYALLETIHLKDIWFDSGDEAKRPDILRDFDGAIGCRSKKKLEWMMKRLKANHFTDFWV